MKINRKQKFILKIAIFFFISSFVFSPTEICSGYTCSSTGTFNFLWERSFGEKIHYPQLLLFWVLITICASILFFVTKYDRDSDASLPDSKFDKLNSIISSSVKDSNLNESPGSAEDKISNSVKSNYPHRDPTTRHLPEQKTINNIKYSAAFYIVLISIIFFLSQLIIKSMLKSERISAIDTITEPQISPNLLNSELNLLKVKSNGFFSEIYFGNSKIVPKNDLTRWSIVEISDQIFADENKINFVAKLQFNAWTISNDLLFVSLDKKSDESKKILFDSDGSAIRNITMSKNGEISVVLSKIVDKKRMKVNFHDGKISKLLIELTQAETEEACHQLYGFFETYSVSENTNFASNTTNCIVKDFSDLSHVWDLRGVDSDLFDQLKDGNFFDKERLFSLAGISCSQKIAFKESDFKNAICKPT